MSIGLDRRNIQCDGLDCSETAPLPVALRSELMHSVGASGVQGWLFVSENSRTKHFCPDCGRDYLAGRYDNFLSDPERALQF